MNWTHIWLSLFGRSTLMGIDMGFWVSMAISALVALTMVLVFWNTKPYEKPDEQHNN